MSARLSKVMVSIRSLLHTFYAYHVTRRYIVRQKKLLEKKMYFIQYKDTHDKYNTTQYVQVYLLNTKYKFIIATKHIHFYNQHLFSEA